MSDEKYALLQALKANEVQLEEAQKEYEALYSHVQLLTVKAFGVKIEEAKKENEELKKKLSEDVRKKAVKETEAELKKIEDVIKKNEDKIQQLAAANKKEVKAWEHWKNANDNDRAN